MNESSLIEFYRHEHDVFQTSYYLMGMLLNDQLISSRVQELSLMKCYIYGGGFLGIQSYRALSKYVKIPAIVDKRGTLKFECNEIVVIDCEDLKKRYCGEVIIVTPIPFASIIYDELSEFVQDDKIIFLGELVQVGV